LTTDLIVGSAPPERAGAASAISETAGELGGAVGIAVFGSIGVAVYRSGMMGIVPAGVSASTAAAARATLGGAIEVARSLSMSEGRQVAFAARQAFIRGVQLCAAISTVGCLALAVFVLISSISTRRASGKR
jgi:DHA2 family multidrug resistance protein-like MFS transporter